MTFAELSDIVRRECGQDADQVLRVICHQCAGESIHVPIRSIRPEILPTDTPKTIQARYRVSKTTAYRWVNAWKP
ncbi:hypothetical protein [Chromatium okenii]|uniref:hypothetical protein n=1 Tax=Chromatium okenii TaxID=61644 RepID=UPI0026EE936E|nr:hypothetical protein [Chromatium okenii]MBV5310765.1 hypothetical protein [Chromatium okenii]